MPHTVSMLNRSTYLPTIIITMNFIFSGRSVRYETRFVHRERIAKKIIETARRIAEPKNDCNGKQNENV